MLNSLAYKKAEHSLFTKYSKKDLSLNRASKILTYTNPGDPTSKKAFNIDRSVVVTPIPQRIKYKSLYQIEVKNSDRNLALAFETTAEASKWVKAITALAQPETKIASPEPINEATSPKLSSKDVAEYYDLLRNSKMLTSEQIFDSFDFTVPFLMRIEKYGPVFCEDQTIDSMNSYVFWVPQKHSAEKDLQSRSWIFSFAGKHCGVGGPVAAIWAMELSKYLKEYHQKFASVKNVFENDESEEFAIFSESYLKFRETGEPCQYLNQVPAQQNKLFTFTDSSLCCTSSLPAKLRDPVFYFDAKTRKLFNFYPEMPIKDFTRAFGLSFLTADALNAQRVIVEESELRSLVQNIEIPRISVPFTNLQLLQIELSSLSAELINLTNDYVREFNYNKLESDQVYLLVHQSFCVIWRGKSAPSIKFALAKALAESLNRDDIIYEYQGMEGPLFRSFVIDYKNKIERIPPPKLEEIPINHDIDVDLFIENWFPERKSTFLTPELIYEFRDTRYNVITYSKKLVLESAAAYAFLIPGADKLKIHIWIGLKTHTACLIAFYKEVYPQLKAKLQGKKIEIYTSIQGDENQTFLSDLQGIPVSFNHSRGKYCLFNVQGPKIDYIIGENYKNILFAVNDGAEIAPKPHVSPFIYHHYNSGLALHNETLYIFYKKNVPQHVLENLRRQSVRLSVSLTIKLQANVKIEEIMIDRFCADLELPVITFARIYSEEKSNRIRMASIANK